MSSPSGLQPRPICGPHSSPSSSPPAWQAQRLLKPSLCYGLMNSTVKTNVFSRASGKLIIACRDVTTVRRHATLIHILTLLHRSNHLNHSHCRFTGRVGEVSYSSRIKTTTCFPGINIKHAMLSPPTQLHSPLDQEQKC